MKELALLVFELLVAWLVIQACVTLVFLWSLRSPEKDSLPDEKLPKAAVILCLRGGDPFLPYCLRSLLHQDYPHYDLKLIVDSKEDPAWKIAHDAIASFPATNVHISTLSIRRYNCSLKCSSLVQAVSELDDSYKVVALVDADAVVHPHWLRELVTPLQDPKVGATTGNRWYLMSGKYWGTTVRFLWNASAVVQMFLYGIPWGGTLALKTEVIHKTGLLDKWARAYGEDTMLRRVLGQHGLKVKFVPSLLILNREEIDLPRLVEWMKRQLLSSRLYHPHWWAVIVDALQTVVLPNLLLALFIATLCTQQWYAAILAFTGFSGYMMALLLLAIALQKGVQQVTSKHGESKAKLSPSTIAKMLLAIPLTNWTHGLALISSLWMSTVNWRGAIYRINGPWNIRLIEYRPYQLFDQPIDTKVSL